MLKVICLLFLASNIAYSSLVYGEQLYDELQDDLDQFNEQNDEEWEAIIDDGVIDDDRNLKLSKKVIWQGPQSYKGYSSSRSRSQYGGRTNKPKKKVDLDKVIGNRDRKNDPVYRQGLQELAGLM
nr:expressed protein [Hymenolepis microstoma]